MKVIRTQILLILILILVGCSSKEETSNLDFEEQILVKIGDRTISVSEFIKRAEYTPRPTYCNNSFPIHKKIILNSLVAEKLFAMEAGLDSAEILKSEFIDDYLSGIKEQAMRQILQYEEGHNKVKSVDTSLVYDIAANMNLSYDVSYINITNKDTANMIARKARSIGLEAAVKEVFPNDSLFSKSVQWHEYENDKITNLLFSKKHAIGTTFEPLEINKKSYLLMKVNNWQGNVAQNKDEQTRTYGRAIDYKTMRKADAYYTGYVQGVMQGKSINFDTAVFYKLLNIMAPIYLETNQNKKTLQNMFFDTKEREVRINNSYDKLKDLMDKQIFTFNGNNWTVKDFFKYRRSHPLVFRDKNLSKEDFPEKFKMAIIDMMTDYVLTEVAYKRGYDKVNIVNRHYEMWKDNLVSEYYKSNFITSNKLDSIYKIDQEKIFNEYLNPYITELQKKYSDQIEFNKDAFMKIELNRIPMTVHKPLSPFPIVVPSFPIITTKDALDYGKLMNQ